MKSTMNHSEAPPRFAAALIGRLKRYRSAVLALVLLGSGTASQAGMIIRVTEDPTAPGVTNGSTVTFTFTGDGNAPVLYGSDFGGGTGIFGTFSISSISAISNSATVGPQAVLTVNVTAMSLSAGHTLEVDVTDDHYTHQTGPNFFISSSASDTNGQTTNDDTHTYLSFAGNSAFGTTFPVPSISYNLGNGANGGITTYSNYTSSAPFSITSYTIFDSASGNGGVLQATGSTIVSVPEPGTAVLMGLGFGVLGLASLRRRRRAA